MKKIPLLLFSILILSCAPRISQAEIQSDLMNYFDLIQNGNYKEAVNYMPTNFWDHYDKKEFISRLNQLSEITGNILIENTEIIKISERKKIDNNYFKIIDYVTNLSFDSSRLSENVIENYESKFGKENVEFDTINKKIKIQNKNSLISVFDKNAKEWRFMELTENGIIKLYGLNTWQELQ